MILWIAQTLLPPLWLLAILYVCFLLNHMSLKKLNGKTPMEAPTGQTPDISPLLVFQWYEPVLYAVESQFPSESNEKPDHFVGIAEDC
jgi:hypothetical protein